MAATCLKLSIQNRDNLPDGGPLDVVVTGRKGIDIGRDQHLDWCLPDPARVISGKHCEIRYRDGDYWLKDVSTNGTFVNGQPGRMQEQYRLRDGDKLEIGHYAICVTVTFENSQAHVDGEIGATPRPSDPWFVPDTPRPAGYDLVKPNQAELPIHTPHLAVDALDWAAELPPVAHANWLSPPREDVTPSAPARATPVARMVADLGMVEPELAELPNTRSLPDTTRMPELAPQPVDLAVLLQLIAKGAGVRTDIFSQQKPEQTTALLGEILRICLNEIRSLLAARMETKGFIRSTSQTTIQAFENNPLKFSPSVEDALNKIIEDGDRSYLRGSQAIQESFNDIKAHQINVYTSMQQAICMIFRDFDPKAIDDALEKDNGLNSVLSNRKARLWDAYNIKWKTIKSRNENGILDVFMRYFSECYERNDR